MEAGSAPAHGRGMVGQAGFEPAICYRRVTLGSRGIEKGAAVARRALPCHSVRDAIKSPPKMARAIRAAMVSFRVLLFIFASEEIRKNCACGGDTAKAEGDDDPVDQDLFAAFDGKIARGWVLLRQRTGGGLGFRLHGISLHCMARPPARKIARKRLRSERLQAEREGRGPASHGWA